MSDSQTEFMGELRMDEPMAKHTTWRVGGPARQFFIPESRQDLCHFLRSLDKSEAILWFGLGSNLLVRDGGFTGTVINTSQMKSEINDLGDGKIYVDAGVACPKIAKFAANHALAGAEFFSGIPGTLGGALAMNAGAFGGETWPLVESVETIDRRGNIHHRTRKDFSIGYRSVSQTDEEWFLSATLRLQPDLDEQARAAIKKLLNQRKATQPLGQPSCGSVFRNPDGDHAARLIEAAGLKGKAIGGACVSTKHANFIINTGGASAADIEQLIERVQQQVADKFGVHLHPEVKIVGQAIASEQA